jgi:hypothetical protein
VYSSVMASWAKPEVRTPSEHKGPTLVPPIEFDIRSVGPGLPRVEAPEGWVKKIERAREGKVWVGYFNVWETTQDGHSVRRKKERPSALPRSLMSLWKSGQSYDPLRHSRARESGAEVAA